MTMEEAVGFLGQWRKRRAAKAYARRLDPLQRSAYCASITGFRKIATAVAKLGAKP